VVPDNHLPRVPEMSRLFNDNLRININCTHNGHAPHSRQEPHAVCTIPDSTSQNVSPPAPKRCVGPVSNTHRGVSPTSFFTDHYELTMVDAARKAGTADHKADFELFARRMPS